MDKERRSRLKRVVGEARRVVEDDVRAQLRRLGIDESGVKPVIELPYLSREDRDLRDRVLKAIEKERVGDISYGEAFGRYVAHVGFTYVNRIAALRAMEVRGLIKETVVRRDVYGGRSRREYEIAEREGILDPYQSLKVGLIEAFEEVSAEIKVLFDVNSEYSLFFPGHRALKELIRLLSEAVPEEDWREDDIIGWIYQYYNEEAREKFKKEKRKPKADDIPVINQFYTPRWVVRVLVDNTLGRLWLEMNRRCPKLGDPVKRTREQLENPSGDMVDEFCSYFVPLSQDPPTRNKKNVREIKVIDPACGSGHFLVYAFDVLYRMYREDEPKTPVEEIPRLILENNLYGIDIDLRAVQLAALSLYLKAKSYNPKLKITKINLVCADARITDGKVRRTFLERFSADPELQKIFAKIFEDLEYTYDVGSLLKVREPFERLLERRREKGMQAILFPRVAGQTVISKSGKIEAQTELIMRLIGREEKEETIVTPKAATLEQMLEALKDFEKEAMEKRDMGTLLFATEAEKSVGLLALLSQKYDVILMNPAYGTMPDTTKKYLKAQYPRTRQDLYSAFIEQAVNLCELNGFLGMLTSRTFMYLGSFENMRKDILWNDALPEVILDLGFGVLDGATVETAATVCRRDPDAEKRRSQERLFIRLTGYDTDYKQEGFRAVLEALNSNKKVDIAFWASLDDLTRMPGATYSYWASHALRSLFVKHPPLDKDIVKKVGALKIADVKPGLQTSDNKRFTRQMWEVDACNIGRTQKWAPFVMGGGAAKFYADADLVVNWEDEGREIKEYVVNRYPYLKGKYEWVVRSEEFYFREGFTWTSKRWAARYLPANVIFGHAGPAGFPRNNQHIWSILALLCSDLTDFLLSLGASEHNWEASDVGGVPTALGVLDNKDLTISAREAHDLLRQWDTGNETSTIFIKPWVLQVLGFNRDEKPITRHPLTEEFIWSDWDSLRKIRSIDGSREMTLQNLAALAMEREEIMLKRLDELQSHINEEVYRIYEISEDDKKLIEKELALRRVELPISEEETGESEEGEQIEIPLDVEAKTKNHVARVISFYIKKTLESDPDGIAPLHQLVQDMRKHLVIDFSEDQVDAKEKEIEEILGKSLEEWVATDYFDFHVNLYKRRPIYWHLTSYNFLRTRGSKGAFNIFIHYHKLDRDTIPKIRVNYLRPELDRAKWKVDHLKRELQEARDAGDKRKERQLSEELDSALSVLEELQNFDKALEEVHNPRTEKTRLPKNPRWVDQKIAEVRDNGYNPVIDYGVRVNIEPLKEVGLLHKAAQRVK